jgi:hemerythrin superfamily protein
MKLKDLIPQGILPESSEEDAIALLRADHDKVEDLFTSFDEVKFGRDHPAKEKLVRDLCSEFRVHSAIEEEIFYPAVRSEIADDDLMNEAQVEHEGARRLVTELETMEAADEMLNAKMHVLCAYIKHHVREEEQDMFPKVRETGIDLRALGARMTKRKRELVDAGRVPATQQRKSRSAKSLSESRVQR